MRELLQTKKIYESEDLQRFVLSLETRYPIESAQERYHSLVNFSANAEVPYHQWFKYREGFAGELITQLIAMSGARAGECIIDPFCGSGTTDVVAVLSGFDTLGLDVNPMSAFIANAKVAHYVAEDLSLAEHYLSLLEGFHEYNYKKAYEDIRKYFNTASFDGLVRIKTYLDTLPETKARNILTVAFYSIIMECSNRKRDGNGLKTSATKVEDVAACYREKVSLILRDIISVRPADTASGFCVCSTAYDLHKEYSRLFGDKPAGAIIFSPPYANSFDYFESYKLELVFGDCVDGMSGMNELRKKAVRSFIGGAAQQSCDPYVDMIAAEIEHAVPIKELETGKKDNRTRKVPNMIRGYFSDMQEVLHQCALTLGPGKKTYIVVDQSAYCGKIVPTDLLLAYLGEREGFRVGKVIKCRKARTSTQQLNKYPYLKTTLRESIVELIKNG